MMQIHISPNDGVPIYLQIVSQVKYLVAAGRQYLLLPHPETAPPLMKLLKETLP